ncbi:hypothetical protein PIB30_041408 [Stylosanthes scabra]|uniref:Uncharacterized protein n=1 Tax=Stylosanthes scabra TaxID=79078 RepID=A0ABU6TER3_9FABA|nr:hypothetical protein [Stylosanthes scabra]
MGDVLWNLEYALQLQEAVLQGDPEENSTNMIGDLSPQINNFDREESVSAAQFESPSLDDLSGVSMSKGQNKNLGKGHLCPSPFEKRTFVTPTLAKYLYDLDLLKNGTPWTLRWAGLPSGNGKRRRGKKRGPMPVTESRLDVGALQTSKRQRVMQH